MLHRHRWSANLSTSCYEIDLCCIVPQSWTRVNFLDSTRPGPSNANRTRDGHGSSRPAGRFEIFEIHYVNFAVFVVFLVEIVMKKCYISTLAKLQFISHFRLKNPVIACRHTGFGRVGSGVTHQLQNVGRFGPKKLTRVQL